MNISGRGAVSECEELQIYFVHTSEKVKKSDGNLYSALIVLAAFVLHRYIDKLQSSEVNATPSSVQEANSKAAIVKSLQNVSLETSLF